MAKFYSLIDKKCPRVISYWPLNSLFTEKLEKKAQVTGHITVNRIVLFHFSWQIQKLIENICLMNFKREMQTFNYNSFLRSK